MCIRDSPRLRQHADEFRRAVRGWWLLFALVLAGAGVVGHDALNLLERLQAPPPEVDLVLPLPTTTTTTTTTPPSTVRDGGVP